MSHIASRLVAAVVLAMIFTAAGAAPVAAIDIPDIPIIGETPLERVIDKACEPGVPALQRPDQGVPSRLAGGRPDMLPAHAPVTAVPTIAEFGYAGMEAGVYDTGCAPGDGIAVETRNWIANRLVTLGLSVTALTEGTERAVHDPEWLVALAPITENVSSRLGDEVFRRWVGAACLVAAIVMTWHVATRAQMSRTASQALWAVAMTTAAVAFLAYPMAVAGAAQKATTAVMSQVYQVDMTESTDPVAGTAAAASQHVYEAVHYPGWLRRTFGTADSPVAKEYGPLLFRAGTLSWEQVDACNASAEECKAITERHNGVYRTLMQSIEQRHPDTYKALQGENGNRPDEALFETLCAINVGWLRLASTAVVGAAVIVLVLVGVTFPVAALIALVPRLEWVGKGLLNAGASAAVFGVVLGMVSWLVTVLSGALLDPALGLDPDMGQLILFVMSVILWVMTRPIKRLVSILSLGMSAKHRNRTRQTARTVGKFAVKASGLAGNAVASRFPRPTQETVPDPPQAPRSTFVAPPPTATPPPREALPAATPPTHTVYNPSESGTSVPGPVARAPRPGPGTYQRSEGAPSAPSKFSPTYIDDGVEVHDIYQRPAPSDPS